MTEHWQKPWDGIERRNPHHVKYRANHGRRREDRHTHSSGSSTSSGSGTPSQASFDFGMPSGSPNSADFDLPAQSDDVSTYYGSDFSGGGGSFDGGGASGDF